MNYTFKVGDVVHYRKVYEEKENQAEIIKVHDKTGFLQLNDGTLIGKEEIIYHNQVRDMCTHITPAVTGAFVVSAANEKCVRVYGLVSLYSSQAMTDRHLAPLHLENRINQRFD